jgi:hypothetical protein
MIRKVRLWWAQRKKREQQLDREYAAEERALIGDPDELGAELDKAEGAARFRGRLFRRPPDEEEHSAK